MVDETRIREIIARHPNHPEQAWDWIARNLLTPADDFSLHCRIYEQCYGEHALLRAPGPAWLPTDADIERANVTIFARQLGLADYPALHRWSIENRAAFWDLSIQRLGVVLRQGYSQVLDDSEPTRPRWLIGARLNIVESCFQGDPDAPAVIESDGTGAPAVTTIGELRARTARVANALAARGIGPGDAVAMILPMNADSVAAYLGVIAAGAAAVSIPDSFAAEEIATRLRISQAKLVITQDAIHWGSKRLPLYEKITAATNLPTIVLASGSTVTPARPADVSFTEFLSNNDRLEPHVCQPHDTINILFSSGTTGEPKAIPWDHTTPIKCAVDAHFHHDLHPGDVACWPTNLGWMMGPWLIFASLMNRATLALYKQAPQERGFGEFIQDTGVTLLGGVPSLVRAWRQSDCMRGLDWSRIRAFSSSGECSNATEMLYLMHLAGYRPVIEYCGGTEIGGAYISSTVVQPNIPATFTTPTLGIDLTVLDDQARPATTGETFLIGPSIGLSTRLLNRDHDAVYFTDTPRGAAGQLLRRHGDELTALPNGYFRVAGRSDDTMNLGGIKVGCAEIERVLNSVPGVSETAAVAIAPPGGGPSRLVVFTVLQPSHGTLLPEELKPAMQQVIRKQLNPLFHVDEIRIVPSLPRTASNKILRRELRGRIG